MKLTLGISEKRTFNHEIEIETENEDYLNDIIKAIEEKLLHAPSCIDDYVSALEKFQGITIISYCEDDDGDLDSLECDDVYDTPSDENQ